jgi:hypothetical protein
MLLICIWEAYDSNLSRNSKFLGDVFHGTLQCLQTNAADVSNNDTEFFFRVKQSEKTTLQLHDTED